MSVAFIVAVAILFGLLLFLYQEARRPVSGDTPRWQKKLRISLVAIVLLLSSLGFWAFFIEPNRLIIQHQTIQISNWPKELSGLRIAVISDIHAGSSFIDDRKLRLIVERTNQLQPELIVILGDYMSHDGWTSRRIQPEVFAPVLKEFHAPLGVYSVLGNHDWWFDGDRVRRALETNGISVIDDEVIEVRRGNASVWLAGLGDLWTRPQHIEQTIGKVPPGQTVIALTHNPDIFPRLSPSVPLLLAAHTHGGQVRFPFIGTVVQPSDYGQRYVRGHVFENNHHLFVTSGIGTSILPVRFGVPPEIVLLTVNSE